MGLSPWYVDESLLECVSPVHAPGIAAVLLSMNGQQYAPSGASYTYQPSASVSYVSPSTALSEGGTHVRVHGGGFSSASEALGLLTCRIGGAVRRAVWSSSSIGLHGLDRVIAPCCYIRLARLVPYIPTVQSRRSVRSRKSNMNLRKYDCVYRS